MGNDVFELQVPGPSKRLSGYEELFAAPDELTREPSARPVLRDLVHALGDGSEPELDFSHGVASLRLGLGLFQSAREGHRVLSPAEVDPALRTESR